LSKLSLWMERLLEGSLQRFYIPSWPELDWVSFKERCELFRFLTCPRNRDFSVLKLSHQTECRF
jgi:hypothetical protein